MKYGNALQYWGRLIFCAVFIMGLAVMQNTSEAKEGEEIHHRLTHYRPVISWKQVEEKDKVTILGPATISQERMVEYILSRNPQPKLSCSLEELVAYYYEEAGDEGIRPDIALCQALKETGFFNYGNDVKPLQNNYCGLGALGNKVPGYTFFTPRRGVRAHIQHLVAYAANRLPNHRLIDPRFTILVEKYPQYHGAAKYWPDLNGRWAVPGTTYGQDILRLWREAGQFQVEDSELERAVAAAEASRNIEGWEKVYALALGAGNYREAISSMDKVLQINDRKIDAYVKRGDIFREWGYNEQALADYNKALSLDKENYAARSGRAYLYASIQENRRALADYDTMLGMNPNDTIALYNRGCLMADEGKYPEAKKALERLLTLEPNNVYAKQAYDDLKKYLK